MTGSPLLLQLQANLLGCEVAKPAMKEVHCLSLIFYHDIVSIEKLLC